MPNTTRLSLRYPSTSDTADVPRDIGNLASDLDNAAIFSKGTFAARPTSTVGSPGIDGRYYFATDDSTLYLDTGTSWVAVNALAANAVTAAKIDATVAGYLALTEGANTRRWSVSAATERSTTSTTNVDVTGASISVDDVLGDVMFFTYSAELKNSSTSSVFLSVFTDNTYVDVSTTNYIGAGFSGSKAQVSGAPTSSGINGSTYKVVAGWGMYSAFATRTSTIKAQFLTLANTGYVKNVTIDAWRITP